MRTSHFFFLPVQLLCIGEQNEHSTWRGNFRRCMFSTIFGHVQWPLYSQQRIVNSRNKSYICIQYRTMYMNICEQIKPLCITIIFILYPFFANTPLPMLPKLQNAWYAFQNTHASSGNCIVCFPYNIFLSPMIFPTVHLL